jgi:TetR/AcrR family transcriptional regulator, transcriptional repressor of aconitase
MPKVSDEHRERRREQILEGARRAFARYGHAGATVRRLEEETGLSRGAIFHYFDGKDALFIELAGRDAERIMERWRVDGGRALVEDVAQQDPDWLRVYLELLARLRVDPELRERWQERQAHWAEAPLDVAERQRAGELRDDVPPVHLSRFMGLVADGIAMQRASGEEVTEDELRSYLLLLDDAIAPRPGQETVPAR